MNEKYEELLRGLPAEVQDELKGAATQEEAMAVSDRIAVMRNGTFEQIEAILPTVLADPDPACKWHRSHDNYIDCYARGVDKGAALAGLCERLGFRAENAMAIGDNENDLSMLHAAGVAVVMISSELEELRQTCDRIAIVSGGRIAGILPATDSSEAFGMLMVSQVK